MQNSVLNLLLAVSIFLGGCGGGDGKGAGANASVSVQPLGVVFAATPVAPSVSCTNNTANGVNVVATASRLSGVAPLSVIFDATGTTGAMTTRPFHELTYRWSFGDPSAGNWRFGTANLLSKNTAIGAMSGHVFENAGPHTVTLTVSLGNTTLATGTCAVNVSDPDTDAHYAGNLTACIGTTLPSAGVGGCPVGALVYSAPNNVDAVINTALTVGGARRILLKRGDSFTANNWIVASQTGPVTIGPFGSGLVKPVINMSVANGYLFNLFNAPTDWRFTNLDFNGMGSNVKFSAPNGTNLSTNLLFHQLIVRNAGGMNASRTNVAIVDSEIGPIMHRTFETDGSIHINGGNNGIWASDAFGFYFAGNNISDTQDGEHGMRIQGAANGSVSHNSFANAATTKQVFTLRGYNYNTVPYITKNIIVSDNIFELTKPTEDNWMSTISPQNQNRQEEIRDVVVERNLYQAVSGASRALMISASDVTIRNNLFNQTNIESSIDIFYDSLVGLSHASNVKIQNNTFLSLNGANFSAVTVSDLAPSNIEIKSNLAFAKTAVHDSSHNGIATFLNNKAASERVPNSGNIFSSGALNAPALLDINDLTVIDNWQPTAAIPASFSVIVGAENDFLDVLRISPVDAGAVQH